MSKRGYNFSEMEDAMGSSELKKEHIKTLTPSMRKRVFALNKLHKKYTESLQQYKQEVDALDRKYAAIYAPLYEYRAAIAAGTVEPSPEDLVGYEAAEKKAAEEEAAAAGAAGPLPSVPETGEKGIPFFWYHALVNNDAIRELSGLNDDDRDALKYLVDIQCTQLPRVASMVKVEDEEKMVVKLGFEIKFTFRPNPYFNETVLRKTYHLVEDEISGDPVFEYAESDKLTWKDGNNLTVRVVKRTVRGRRGAGRMTNIEEDRPSFFRFFSAPQFPEIGDEVDQNELEELTALVQEDFEIGCEIRDRICPSAILWYTGEAADDDEDEDEYDIDTIDEDDEDDEDGNGDYDDDEDEDDEDDEDEEDEDDEDDEDGMGDGSGATVNKNSIQNTECKQQ